MTNSRVSISNDPLVSSVPSRGVKRPLVVNILLAAVFLAMVWVVNPALFGDYIECLHEEGSRRFETVSWVHKSPAIDVVGGAMLACAALAFVGTLAVFPARRRGDLSNRIAVGSVALWIVAIALSIPTFWMFCGWR